MYRSHSSQIKELSKLKEQSQADLGPRVFHLNKYVTNGIIHDKTRSRRTVILTHAIGAFTRCDWINCEMLKLLNEIGKGLSTRPISHLFLPAILD